MSNVLIVISSARKNRVADKVFEHVKKDIDAREGMHITVADLAEINLPFFDSEIIPGSPDYAPTDPAVAHWQKLVKDADAVILLTPEYNHSINGMQKNALDSLYGEWNDKPVVMIGYGWSGAALAYITLKEVLSHLKADFKPNSAHLAFMKDLTVDGSILDQPSTFEKIKKAIDEIV